MHWYWHRQEWNTMQRVGRDDEREEEEGGDQQREKEREWEVVRVGGNGW